MTRITYTSFDDWNHTSSEMTQGQYTITDIYQDTLDIRCGHTRELLARWCHMTDTGFLEVPALNRTEEGIE